MGRVPGFRCRLEGRLSHSGQAIPFFAFLFLFAAEIPDPVLMPQPNERTSSQRSNRSAVCSPECSLSLDWKFPAGGSLYCCA